LTDWLDDEAALAREQVSLALGLAGEHVDTHKAAELASARIRLASLSCRAGAVGACPPSLATLAAAVVARLLPVFDTSMADATDGLSSIALPADAVANDAATPEQIGVHARRRLRWGGDGDMPLAQRRKRIEALWLRPRNPRFSICFGDNYVDPAARLCGEAMRQAHKHFHAHRVREYHLAQRSDGWLGSDAVVATCSSRAVTSPDLLAQRPDGRVGSDAVPAVTSPEIRQQWYHEFATGFVRMRTREQVHQRALDRRAVEQRAQAELAAIGATWCVWPESRAWPAPAWAADVVARLRAQSDERRRQRNVMPVGRRAYLDDWGSTRPQEGDVVRVVRALCRANRAHVGKRARVVRDVKDAESPFALAFRAARVERWVYETGSSTHSFKAAELAVLGRPRPTHIVCRPPMRWTR
jgi:hypothetical protein